jgi:hypothetical protein
MGGLVLMAQQEPPLAPARVAVVAVAGCLRQLAVAVAVAAVGAVAREDPEGKAEGRASLS